MSEITSKLAHLNPFKSRDDDEDLGEAIGADSVGGGGRATQRSGYTKGDLRVSDALRSFLVHHKVITEKDAKETGAVLHEYLSKAVFEVPAELLDRSHPLPDYYVSSSHNTYLIAHQLYGKSSASAYETALKTGSRCVEIDAWDNSDDKDEPKVTHGYTLVSHISFRKVCETIRDMHDEEAAFAQKHPTSVPGPILVSLENHCGPQGQLRLVEIMTEILGDRLLSKPVREEGHREQAGESEHVTLAELGSKIVIIVEHHLSDEKAEDSESTSDDESNEDEAEERAARKEYNARKKAEEASPIIPELAALGVYAQSVKPQNNSWFDPGELTHGPHHHLINVSETGLSKHLPSYAVPISVHNSRHLMRVFPKGTRIGSSNLRPVKFWGIGAQICALNWQTFGLSNQLNDALFDGSEGYILKPAALRSGGDGNIATGKRKKLRLHVAGATDVPLHSDREEHTLKPYLTCNLYSPLETGEVPKRKTAVYKHHKLGFLHHGDNPERTDPIWDETLEWEYEDNELVFLRMLIKSDDSWARNPKFAVAAVRLSYVTPGWTFVRMLDVGGRETKCTLLLNFEITDA